MRLTLETTENVAGSIPSHVRMLMNVHQEMEAAPICASTLREVTSANVLQIISCNQMEESAYQVYFRAEIHQSLFYNCVVCCRKLNDKSYFVSIFISASVQSNR